MKRALSLFAATTLASTFAWAQSSAPVVQYSPQGQTIPAMGEGLPTLAPVQKPQMLAPMAVPAPQPDATPGYGVPVMSSTGGVQVIPEAEVGQYQDQTSVPMTGVSRPYIAPTSRRSRRSRQTLPVIRSTDSYAGTGPLRVMAPSGGAAASTPQSYGPETIPMMGDAVIPPSEKAAVAAQSALVVSPQAMAPSAGATNVAGPFTTPAEALQRAPQAPQPGMAANGPGSAIPPGVVGELEREYGAGSSAPEAANAGMVTPESYQASLRQVSMDANGSCQTVHPGDVVHFTLRIENVEDARYVFSHLQLSLNGHAHSSNLEFPIPEHDSIGGGGVGRRDPMSARVYHFSLVVPEVQSGFYRTTGMDVRASFGQSSADPGVGVPLDRHSRDQVRSYCLAVSGGGGQRPVVTDFHGGPVERASNGGSMFR